MSESLIEDPKPAQEPEGAPEDSNPNEGFFELIRRSLRGESVDATRGTLGRIVLLLAVPMVLELAMESIFVICDAFFLMRYDEYALAAVGLTESMLTIVYGLGIGLAMATTAMVARRFGEGKEEAARDAAIQSMIIGMGLSLLVAIPGILFADDFLRWMNASEEVIAKGTVYTQIQLGGNLVIIFLFLNNAIFRGLGDATLSMRSLIVANGVNLILDPCLIFGLGPFPEMGLQGAAIATVTGRGIGALYQLNLLFSGSGRLELAWRHFRVLPAVIARLFSRSLSGMIQFLVPTASGLILYAIIADFGDAALSGYTLAFRIFIFAFMPAFGMTNAVAVIVGQNLGAGNPDRAHRSVVVTGNWVMGMLAIETVLLIVFADPIVAIFTSQEAVASVATEALAIFAAGNIFYAWGMVTMQAFNGAGDTATPIWVNLGCFWLYQLPMAWYLSHRLDFGASGSFWALASSYCLHAIVGVILFRIGKWKTRTI